VCPMNRLAAVDRKVPQRLDAMALPVPDVRRHEASRRGRPMPGCPARAASPWGSARRPRPRRRMSCRLTIRTRGDARPSSPGRARDSFGEQHAQDLGGIPPLRGGGREHLGRGAADIGHPQQPVRPRPVVTVMRQSPPMSA
jgi:hypothetical protein